MLELTAVDATVVACLADPPAVDAVAASWPATFLRLAPDEALLIDATAPKAAPAAAPTVADIAEIASSIDPDAVVTDAGDGWTAWRIDGDRTTDAFSRLSQMPPPDGFAQGEVAHVRAKVVLGPTTLLLLVPAMWSAAVRERILADCADLAIRERGASRTATDAAEPGR